MNYLLVALGAGAGGMLRYLLASLSGSGWFGLVPGTLLANGLGGLLTGLFFASPWYRDTDLKLFLATGFLGGLTTFSTFTLESMQLLSQQKYLMFATHGLLHFGLSLLLFVVGAGLMRAMTP